MASSRSRTNPSLVCVSVQVCLTQITSFVSKEFGVVSFTARDLNAILSFAAAFFLISCVTAVSGSVRDPRVVLSCRVIKSGFFGLERSALFVGRS
ncbi:hypothetical protein F2Q70_00008709 [Brassica cretica]|uniref:Uncharacterized protein n=1 Tax=Brassica cretica TaxID=69181 RepID=A0A8S9ME07_BRACR|nr:hypothetical protein F2Q70_00008709 [Brassica cretica]